MIRPRRCPAKERGVTEGKGMLARLGNVLYWLCTGVAAVFVIGGLSLALTSLGNVGTGIDKEK